MKKLRVRAVRALGRLLGVPVQVHQTFFVKGMN